MALGEFSCDHETGFADQRSSDPFSSYAVDSLVLLLQSVIATQAFKELGPVGYSAGLTVAVYGMMPALPLLPWDQVHMR